MYPKNAASPERIAIGPVVQISDGAVQTSGVTVSYLGMGGSEGAGGGTVAYSTGGCVLYTPLQAETNYSSIVFTAYKTGCIPASVTVVPTLSATAGQAVTADNQKVDVNTVKTQTVTAGAGVTVGAYVGNATAALAADANGRVQLQTGTGAGQLDFTSGVVKASLAQILGAALTGTAANIVGSFTKFFDKTSPTGTINSLPDAVAGANGGLPTTNGTKVSQTVDLTAGQSIACSDKSGFSLAADQAVNVTKWKGTTVPTPGVAGVPSVDASYVGAMDATLGVHVADIASDAITAASVKADAVTKIQTGLATPANVVSSILALKD